jgi:hypothetical protein
MNKPPNTPLSNNPNSESARAVEECIRMLNPTRKQSLEAVATLILYDPPRDSDSIHFTFHRHDLHDFPKVEFNADIMRSFGIPYGSFDPNWDTFTFEKESMKLCVVSGENRFALSGIRLV